MAKAKNKNKKFKPDRAEVEQAFLNATSTKTDAHGRTKIVLFWKPVQGVTGYNLYRSDKKGPLNGLQPITQVDTCARLQAFVPKGSKAWLILANAFASVASRNARQIVPDRWHRGQVVDPSGFFAARRLTVATKTVQDHLALLPPDSDPCVVIQRGLTSEEQALFDNLANANLPIRLARGWATVDSAVVSGVDYTYELRGVLPDQQEIVLDKGLLVTAGFFRLPGPPSGFQLDAGDSEVLALWNRNVAAFSYTLQRADNPGGPFRTVNNSPIFYNVSRDLDNQELTPPRPGFVDSQSWDEDGLPVPHKVEGVDINGPANGKTYFYRVASCDILGRNGSWSATKSATPSDTTPPMAPTDLQVNPYQDNPYDPSDKPGLMVTWRKVTRDIKNHQMIEPSPTYQIYRSDRLEDLNDLGALPAFLINSYIETPPDPTRLTLSWTDRDPALRVPYGEKDFWYRIICVDLQGNASAPSAVLAARVEDTIPPGPSQVTGADGFADHIIVYWLPNPEPDLGGYQVYRGVCDRGKFYMPPREERCDFLLVGDVQKSEAEKRLAQTGKIYFEDFSVPAGSSVCYAYWVRAYDHAGNLYTGQQGCPREHSEPGAYPEYACQRLYEQTPPPVPIITALKARDRAVQVEWVSAPAQDLRAFHIYRSENELDPPVFVGCILNDGSIYPGPWTGMKPDCEDIPAEADPAACRGTYLDQTVEPNHIYWYRVSALDWLGNESEASNLTKIPAISTFTYDRGLPLPPVVQPAGASNPDECGLQISWAPAFNPLTHKGIMVFRSRAADGGYRQVSSIVPADHFEDLSALRGVDYWYRVQAMALDGTLSQPSAPVHYRY